MSQVNTNSIYDASGGSNAVLYGVAAPANSMGFRNRIINGAMVIDQRNNGAAITATGFPVDRWNFYKDTAGVSASVQRSTTAPSSFVNSIGLTVSTGATPAAGEGNTFMQPIEGFNVADLGWGAAGAQAVTVSFWVRSSLTGTFGGSITNSANNRSYPFTYTISAANTFEYKTVTIPGDTTGTWLTNNGVGLRLWFGLGVGSSLSGAAGSWSGNLYLSATGATSVVGTNGATFYITGVQLEAGSVASPFERRDYGRELIMCCRYYWQLDATSSPYTIIGITGNTDAIHTYWNPVPMRAAPSAAFASGSFTAFYFTSAGSGQLSTSIVQGVNTVNFNTSTNGGRFYFTKSGQTGLVAWCDFGGSSAKFTISAEL